jgi:hypothetical protein
VSWHPFGPLAALTSLSMIAVSICRATPTARASSPLVDIPSDLANAMLTCSGKAGADASVSRPST